MNVCPHCHEELQAFVIDAYCSSCGECLDEASIVERTEEPSHCRPVLHTPSVTSTEPYLAKDNSGEVQDVRHYYRYLTRDFTFVIASVGILFVWAAAGLRAVFGITIEGLFKDLSPIETVYGALALTALLSLVVMYRWSKIRNLFGCGYFLNAKVMEVGAYRVRLCYKFNEEYYEKTISPPDSGPALYVGREIKIVVDPRHPKNMAIAE